jgi:anti-anti-sigma factor
LTLLDRLIPGDHVCWTTGDEAVRLDSLTEVAETGFREGHRVVYCGDDTADVLAAFAQRGLPTGRALASGDLRVPPIESSYLTAGVFDPQATLSFLHREIGAARDAGYRGLRIVADMSWASRLVPGIERLLDYETEINKIFAEGYVLGVCAYDRRAFTTASLRNLARSHPGTVRTGRPFDPARALRVRHTWQPFGLRLEGEADLLNESVLRAVIDHLLDILPDEYPRAAVDVSGLTFVDTAAARVLLQAPDRAAGRIRLVGRSPALDRLIEFHGAEPPADTA